MGLQDMEFVQVFGKVQGVQEGPLDGIGETGRRGPGTERDVRFSFAEDCQGTIADAQGRSHH